MKSLKPFLTLIAFFFAISLLSAQATEKTFVKSFNLKGSQVVVLDLEGNIEVMEWKKQSHADSNDGFD